MFKKRDIVIVRFPFTDGSDYKLRPALVLSSDKINKTGDTLIMQITSKQKSDGLSIELTDSVVVNSLPLKSYLRIHKIFIIENRFIFRKISEVKPVPYSKITNSLFKLIQE